MGLEWVWGLLQPSWLQQVSPLLHKTTLTTATGTCAPLYKQTDGALHCHDVLTLKAVLNKKKFWGVSYLYLRNLLLVSLLIRPIRLTFVVACRVNSDNKSKLHNLQALWSHTDELYIFLVLVFWVDDTLQQVIQACRALPCISLWLSHKSRSHTGFVVWTATTKVHMIDWTFTFYHLRVT